MLDLMFSLDGGPEVIASRRRRASTARSTGLDYASCYQVDEDILSRIRSLLLSRNDSNPPQTPNTSGEQQPNRFTRATDPSKFDFSSAKSVAKLARVASAEQLTLPKGASSLSKSGDMTFDRRPSEPQSSTVQPEAPLRTSSSVNDLPPTFDDALVHATELTCCPPCPPELPHSKSWFPKLVLQDSKPIDKTVKSCVEINTQVPINDAEIHKNELECCPPCVPTDKPTSKYTTTEAAWPGRPFLAEPADLACFLAGCPPGRINCKGHHRNPSKTNPSSMQDRSLKEDIKAVAGDLAKDVAKISQSVTGVIAAKSPIVLTDMPEDDPKRPYSPPRSPPPAKGSVSRRSRSNDDGIGKQPKILSRKAMMSPSESSLRSSATSNDKFPHAIQSLEVAAQEIAIRPFSTTVATNFSLPGPKYKVVPGTNIRYGTVPRRLSNAHPGPKQGSIPWKDMVDYSSNKSPSRTQTLSLSDSPAETQQNGTHPVLTSQDVIRPRQSTRSLNIGLKPSKSSLKSKGFKTPSLLSGASRSSAFRHPLLKPSISDLQPVDLGLPVPAVLTPVISMSDMSMIDQDASKSNQNAASMPFETAIDEPINIPNRALTNVNVAVLTDLPASRSQTEGQPADEVCVHYTRQPSMTQRFVETVSEKSPDVRSTFRNAQPDSSPHETEKGLNSSKSPERFTVEAIVPQSTVLDTSGTGVRNEAGFTSDQEDVENVSPLRISSRVQSSSQKEAQLHESARDLPLNVKERFIQHKANDGGNSTVEDLPNGFGRGPSTFSSPEEQIEDPPKSGNLISGLVTESSNVAYWGFEPTFKESVQDAVQTTVRKVMDDISVPPGTKPDMAANAYRRLVAESLTEAAKEADKYLRRSSVWKERELSEHAATNNRMVASVDPRIGSTLVQVSQSRLDMIPALDESSRGSTSQEKKASTPSKLAEATPAIAPPQNNGCQICPDPTKHSFSSRKDDRVKLAGGTESSTADEIHLENQKQGWKISSPFRKASVAGYVAIPTRQSSANRVLSPKTRSVNSPGHLSSKGMSPSKNRSYERLPSRGSKLLRSVSSEGSLVGLTFKKNGQTEQPLLPQMPKDESDNIGSLSHMRSNERLRTKNTVHWLKDLLSSNGPYETRLTALPPRTRRDQQVSTGRIRSQTAPSVPVTELFLGATPNPVDINAEANRKFGIAKADDRALVSEKFTKTIDDLENLLNEALIIARLAAEREGKALPSSTPSKSKTENVSKIPTASKGGVQLSYGSRLSEELSSLGSIHESARSYSGSSNSDDEDDLNSEEREEAYERIRDTALKLPSHTTPTSHPSGWPPTGRVYTPYPPSTLPPSRESLNVDIADAAQQQQIAIARRATELIKHADPRSKPAETKIGSSSYTPNLDAEIRADGRASISFKTLEPFRSRTGDESKARLNSNSPSPLSPAKTLMASRRTTRKSASTIGPKDTPVVLAGESLDNIPPVPMPKLTPRGSANICGNEHSTEDHEAIRTKLAANSIPSKREVRDYITEFRHPPIQPRASSTMLRRKAEQTQSKPQVTTKSSSKVLVKGQTFAWQDVGQEQNEPSTRMFSENPKDLHFEMLNKSSIPYSHSFDGSQITHSEEIDFNHAYGHKQHGPGNTDQAVETTIIREREVIQLNDAPNPDLPITKAPSRRRHIFSLKNERHVSLRDHKGFSLARSHKRQRIARDWSPARKRFCAAVACLSTALVGILVGIYAGETPSIQYYIVDFHHYTVLGNVFFFIGLSIPTFLFWPLPLLHGRKPYILGAMSLAMPLLFPQAVAVSEFRSPYISHWRVALILPRALMGLCLGFANMNFKGILTDLFGASLQSENPHQEHVDEFDVRRHGGGMGVWLGLWTWSAMGSIGLGFLIGAVIINSYNPAWGFYVSITIIAFILLLNVLTPEVRRSAFRRSVAEVKSGQDVSRRLARGEVKMHLVQTGPKWWGEEFHYGLKLSLKMLKQPGFMVMAVYVAWMYGQIVLIVLLLGSLCSNSYKFKSPEVGAAVAAVPLGALIAIPFQKASIFSRDRNHAPKSDDDTYKKKVKWTSHFVRRAIFVLTLPFAGLGYTLTSSGPPIPFILPILFAALTAFLSNLAMAECHGIIMETYDTSDLQPGMTGRPRGSAGDKSASKRTNYSSFPRVASAFAITQGFGYLIAAAASGVGGSLTRNLGQQAATGIMAFILLILSLGLLGILIRFKDVQIIPDSKKAEMDQYHQARRASASVSRRATGIAEEEPWRPVIIGNPHHSTRRMCVLELGSMSRFSEIRRKNRLVDEQSLEARHPNAQMVLDVKMKIKEKELQVVENVRRSLSRGSSRRSKFSDEGRAGSSREPGDLGGHREMGNMHSGNGTGRRRATNIRE